MKNPREKYLKYDDPKKLSTVDLIAILLGHGSPKLDVFELSDLVTELLRSKLNQKLSIDDLIQYDGIGEVKAMQIVSALELGRRFYSSTLPPQFFEEDWDFAELKQSDRQYGVHFFHHYTAKFIPQIPARLIRKLATPNSIILDPFMGSGTTLVEAKIFGCNSYGLDTNPLAIKIANAKTMKLDDDKHDELTKFLKWLEDRKKNPNQKYLSSSNPNLFPSCELWFREDVAEDIGSILDEINKFSPDVKNFLEVGLSTLLKGMSNARMDSVTPMLPESSTYIDRKHYYREVNNLTRNIPVYSRVYSQVSRMKRAILDFNKETDTNLTCSPILGDARQLTDFIDYCDLVVTSPPYWSAQNYGEIHKLSIKLFDLETDQGSEIGRDASTYLKDMEEVFVQITKVLNGYFALVIGEDKNRKQHEKLFSLTINAGFRHVDTIVRRISNQVSRAKQIKQEFIYIFRI